MNAQETQEMLEAMAKDKQNGKASYWSPSDGENIIRFLPPMKQNQEVMPYLHHKVHWIDGTPYECPNQELTDKDGNLHAAEPCPACKASKKLYKISEKGSEERDLAYDLSGKDRYVFRIIDRIKNIPAEPEFYEVGPTIFKKFYSILASQKFGNIVNPKDGRDFNIDKQGTGRLTKYDSSMPEPNVSQIFDNLDDMKTVLQKATNMKYNELISFKSVSELKVAVEEYLNPGEESEPQEIQKPQVGQKVAVENSVVAPSAPAVEQTPEDAETDSLLDEFI